LLRRGPAFAVAVAALAAAGIVSPAHASGIEGHRHVALQRVLFDDFSYFGRNDPRVTRNGWYLRNDTGRPGPQGAQWSSRNISFTHVNGSRVLELTATTDGTGPGTTEAEFGRVSNEALSGTYVARIKFSDVPFRGPDGDHLNQTFYALSSNISECGAGYSETDFDEYLPNGGYGVATGFNTETTWREPDTDCDSAALDESDQYDTSIAGWHTIMSTVAGGKVTYYVDGQIVGGSDESYYPQNKMSIAFNEWFADLKGHQAGSGTSVWHEDVDYVYYAADRVLTPAQAAAQVHHVRRSGHSFIDTLRRS